MSVPGSHAATRDECPDCGCDRSQGKTRNCSGCVEDWPARSAARSQRFTVEGDPTHVRELAEAEGWKIAYPRWWQRTYAIPRWIVWLVVAQAVVGLPRAIEQVTTWL